MSSISRDSSGRYLFLRIGGSCYVCDLFSEPIGSGAIGIVYCGFEYTLHFPVAIKIIRPEYSVNDIVRKRTYIEAGMTFLHDNIVRILGMCQEDSPNGFLCVVSEFISGMTFSGYRKQMSNIDPIINMIDIVQKSIPILDALSYIHGMGVIHRDIKPSNIMISNTGIPKLMDFGIAGFGEDGRTSNGFIGTALYAAPEWIQGHGGDQRSDIYAMGVTLYELLTGFNPYDAETQEEILEKHLYETLPKCSLIPNKLYKIIRKATAINPAERYFSAADFSSELTRFISQYV